MEGGVDTVKKRGRGLIRERAAKPLQPFLLYLALSAPHTPWLPAPQFNGRSKAGIYGDFVAQVDDTLGRIVATINETGIADNTLLIFTSDNGAHWTPEDRALYAHLANGHWRGQKADIWDAGHRIPFRARVPGHLPAGRATARLRRLGPRAA